MVLRITLQKAEAEIFEHHAIIKVDFDSRCRVEVEKAFTDDLTFAI
jgi:hypothetical protein